MLRALEETWIAEVKNEILKEIEESGEKVNAKKKLSLHHETSFQSVFQQNSEQPRSTAGLNPQSGSVKLVSQTFTLSVKYYYAAELQLHTKGTKTNQKLYNPDKNLTSDLSHSLSSSANTF